MYWLLWSGGGLGVCQNISDWASGGLEVIGRRCSGPAIYVRCGLGVGSALCMRALGDPKGLAGGASRVALGKSAPGAQA